MPMTRRLPVSAAALGLAACWALPALAADDPVGKETTPGNAQAETPGERAPVLRPGDDGREKTGIFSFVLENDLLYNTDQHSKNRSAERRVGKEGVSTGRNRCG